MIDPQDFIDPDEGRGPGRDKAGKEGSMSKLLDRAVSSLIKEHGIPALLR